MALRRALPIGSALLTALEEPPQIEGLDRGGPSPNRDASGTIGPESLGPTAETRLPERRPPSARFVEAAR